MRSRICISSLVFAISFPAWASLYTTGDLPGSTIPDNSTIGTGDILSVPVGGQDSSITAVTLNFVLQHGAAGDLSGYLRVGNDVDSPAYDLTSLIRSQSLSESLPTSYAIDFSTAGFESTFTGLNPNNTWTLFFADTAPGDQTLVNGWSLAITAVPEPVNVALGVFGGVVAVVFVVRNRVVRARLQRWRATVVAWIDAV